MPTRPVQAVVVRHENEQFPREAPAFAADVNNLQSLWDAVHGQTGVPKGSSSLVMQMQNPAGATWWQRWADVKNLPSEELDPIKIKVVKKHQPGAAPPSAADKKGSAGEKSEMGRHAGKKGGAGPKGIWDIAPVPKLGPPLGGEGDSRDVGQAAQPDEANEDVDLVHYNLKKLDKQVINEGLELVKAEAQMLDGCDNERKCAVLARIQDRLATTLITLHEQRTAILVASLAAEDEGGVDGDPEEARAARVTCAGDDDEEDDNDREVVTDEGL